MRQKFKNVYQFRVTLKKISPLIWRRIQVPESYTFWDLHVAIQDAMGWKDRHLHEFRLVNPRTGRRQRIGIPGEEFSKDDVCVPGWELPIRKYFIQERDAARYEYDFGDGWEHSVVLQDIRPRDKNVACPLCVGGRRACPPEDCGQFLPRGLATCSGVSGYENFLKIMGNPRHKEHARMLEWAGGSFDPEHFDPREVHFDDPRQRWKGAFLRR